MVLAAVVYGLPPALADAANPQQIKNEAQQVIEHDDLQRDAPLAERARQQSKTVAEDPALQHELPHPALPGPSQSNIGTPITAGLFVYLLLGVLGVALCIIVYHLYRTHAFGRRIVEQDLNRPLQLGSQPAARVADGPLPELDEIDRLARAGAYAEAIHLMLLRTLEALRRRLGADWAKSMTSREIARRSELAATDRRALKMLVGAVEISRFGGQGANEQIYRACLDQYRLIGAERAMARA